MLTKAFMRVIYQQNPGGALKTTSIFHYHAFYCPVMSLGNTTGVK